MDFTKIYLPQPLTLGEFRYLLPANIPEMDVRNEYRTYTVEFRTNLNGRIRNGERFYSAVEIAERIINIPDEDCDGEDCGASYFRVESITEIPRVQLLAFFVDLAIDRLFKQVSSA